MAILASGFTLTQINKQAHFQEETITELERSFSVPLSKAENYFSPAAAPALVIEDVTTGRVNGKNMAVDMAFYGVAIALAAGVVMFNNVVPAEGSDTLTQLAMIVERMDSLYSLGAQWAAMDTSM